MSVTGRNVASMACGMRIGEVHGELADAEAVVAAQYASECVREPEHVGHHWFPAVDGSGRSLRCSQDGHLFVFPA